MIGKIPLRMAFKTDAVLPIEMEIPSFRVQTYNEMINEIEIRAELDGMEEVQEIVRKQVTTYQQKATRYYDKKVKRRVFLFGDLVCRKLEATGSKEGRGKLAPKFGRSCQSISRS